jgi:thioredoxin-related protein
MARTESQRALPIWLFAIALVVLLARIGLNLSAGARVTNDGDLVRWTAPDSQHEPSGRPVLYDFSAAWCGPCRQMERDVFRNPALAARINGELTPVRIVDRQREDGVNPRAVRDLEERFQVRVFPTVVVADETGRELARMEGFEGSEAFVRLLDQVH